MKALTFAKRNVKEIIRDPLTVFFGLGFPIVILLLLTLIQKNVPEPIFELGSLTPGIAVFGFSFISLFSATLISRDRNSSYLLRLFSSPLTATDFIIGYTLPFLPIAILQSIICFLFAFILGLEVSVNAIYTIIALIPAAILFIGIGLLCGTIFNDKQVGGICGALLTNLSAWLSGTWFNLNLVGGAFKTVAYLLPFVHSVDLARYALIGTDTNVLINLSYILGYSLVIYIFAIKIFKNKMNSGNI